MTERDYRYSVRTRFAILFSPVRLILLIAATAWMIVLNVVYISGGQNPPWLGPLSVVPIFAWLAWMLVTDSRHRREAARRSVTGVSQGDQQ